MKNFNASYSRRRRAGGIMVIALMGLSVATIGFSAWITLLRQKSRAVDFNDNAVQKRIAMRNARASVKEYALQRMIGDNGDADGASFNPFSGWGSITVPVWSQYPMDAATRLSGLNSFSPTYDYPYTKAVTIAAKTKNLTFTDEAAVYANRSHSLRALIRSRNPLISGDLLVVHRPTIAGAALPVITGNIDVYGRVLHFAPDSSSSSYTAKSEAFIAPYSPAATLNVAARDLSGNPLMWSNMAWVPITFGKINGIVDWTGRLNVINDSTNGGNSLRTELLGAINCDGGTPYTEPRGLVSDGNGKVTVTPVKSSADSDLPSCIIGSETSEVIIEGQDEPLLSTYAAFRPAFAVVIEQSDTSVRKLSTIRLRKNSKRRMILAIKQNGVAATTPINIVVEGNTTSLAEWHIVLIAENTPLTITAGVNGQAVTLYGGIQTNSSLTAPASPSSLKLRLETDTRGLIKLSPRAAWVETTLQGTL